MGRGLVVALVVVLVVVGGLVAWGVSVNNQLVVQEQNVNGAWAQVQNQYQRRADLIPNLVETVKGFAAQERGVLESVTQARSRASGVQLTPEALNDPKAMERFQAAQRELSGALSRLLVTVERYPELKSNQNFLDLQKQLEGTENRIAVARNRYIRAVQDYNTTVRQFPVNLTAMMFNYKERPQFTVEDERAISKAPRVDFGTPPPTRDRPAIPPSSSGSEYPVPGK